MATVTLEQVLDQARQLTSEERAELVRRLSTPDQEPHQHSILELRGLGKELWEGIDAQEYVNELRAEWDHRP